MPESYPCDYYFVNLSVGDLKAPQVILMGIRLWTLSGDNHCTCQVRIICVWEKKSHVWYPYPQLHKYLLTIHFHLIAKLRNALNCWRQMLEKRHEEWWQYLLASVHWFFKNFSLFFTPTRVKNSYFCPCLPPLTNPGATHKWFSFSSVKLADIYN